MTHRQINMPPNVEISAREILDSRGNWTLEVMARQADIFVRSGVASGASTGKYEAHELRGPDGHVTQAVDNVNHTLGPRVKDYDPKEQEKIDLFLTGFDGSPNLENYGANAIVGISMAEAKLAAGERNVPLHEHIADLHKNKSKRNILPTPMLNVLNGGKHSEWQGADIQEIMIVPHGASSFTEAMDWSTKIYQKLKRILKEKGYSTLIGDEGGFAPALKLNEEAIEILSQAIDKAGYKGKVGIAIDAAASSFYEEDSKLYNLRKEGQKLTQQEMIDFWVSMVEKYPAIVSIEDGLAEDEWEGWVELTKRLGSKIQIVGDDLLVTNPERIKKAIALKACNALLVKPNQIGTVTQTLQAIQMCQEEGWKTVISHRSGETEDTFIADLAVGVGSGQIKTGAPVRSERNAKYNRLMEIEQISLPKIGLTPVYAGNTPFSKN